MIEETDSVISDDLREQRKQLQAAVHFTVLDTVDGFTIEWNEQHLLSIPDSSGIQDHPEWVPLYRIIYHCDRDGMIDSVVNYKEVRSVIDPLIANYVEQAGLGDDPRVKAILPYFMDSTRMMTRLLTNAGLIHRMYGITLTEGDTSKLSLYSPYSDPTTTDYSIVLDKTPLCSQNYVGVKSWSEPVIINIKDVLPGEVMGLTDLAGFEHVKATGTENMTVCFDPKRSLVTYLDFQRNVQMDTLTCQQRVLIYERK